MNTLNKTQKSPFFNPVLSDMFPAVSILDLTDINPDSYTGEAGNALVVNAQENGMDFLSLGSIINPIIGTGTNNDIPIFNSTYPPIFLDSGVNINSQNMTGVASLTTTGNIYVGQSSGQNEIDLFSSTPNNQILAYDSTSSSLLLGAGISGTLDSDLNITNNSVAPKTINISNVNGSNTISSSTGSTLSDTVSLSLTENTDSHNISMSSAGVSLVCGNSLPLTITTQGNAGTTGDVFTLGSSGAVWQAPAGGSGSVGVVGEINVADGSGGWSDSSVNLQSKNISASSSLEISETTSGNNLTITSTGLSLNDILNGSTLTSTSSAITLNSVNNYPLIFNNGSTNLLYLQNGGSVIADGVNNVSLLAASGITINASGGNPCFNVNDTVNGNNLFLSNTGITLLTGSGKSLNLSLGNSGSCVISLSIGAGGTSYPLILPPTQGSVGETLRNNGSGVLTWGI